MQTRSSTNRIKATKHYSANQLQALCRAEPIDVVSSSHARLRARRTATSASHLPPASKSVETRRIGAARSVDSLIPLAAACARNTKTAILLGRTVRNSPADAGKCPARDGKYPAHDAGECQAHDAGKFPARDAGEYPAHDARKSIAHDGKSQPMATVVGLQGPVAPPGAGGQKVGGATPVAPPGGRGTVGRRNIRLVEPVDADTLRCVECGATLRTIRDVTQHACQN